MESCEVATFGQVRHLNVHPKKDGMVFLGGSLTGLIDSSGILCSSAQSGQELSKMEFKNLSIERYQGLAIAKFQ